MNVTPRARHPRQFLPTRRLPGWSLDTLPMRLLVVPLTAVVIVALTVFGSPAPAMADDTTVPATAAPAVSAPCAAPTPTPTDAPVTADPAAADPAAPVDPAEPVAAPCPTDAPAPVAPPGVPVPVPGGDPAATPAPEPQPEPEPANTPEPAPTSTPIPTTEPTGEPVPEPTATSAPPAPEDGQSAPAEPSPTEPTPTEPTPTEPTPTEPPSAPAPPPAEPTAGTGSAAAAQAQAAAAQAQAAAAQAAAEARNAEAQASAAQAAAADARRAAAAQAAATAQAAERIRSAEQAVAARASAQHSAAYSAALARSGRAQAAYDQARLAYAGAKADYDATVVQADLVRDLGADATATAEASRRVLATLVRATLQQSGPAAVDVLLAGNSEGDDLLARLATLETLDRLTNSLDEVQAQVDADAKREKTLQDQDAALRATIEAIPLADTRLAMEDAQRELDAASAEVADLAASTPAAFTLTALPDLAGPSGPAGPDDFGGRLRGQLSGQGWAAPAVGSLTDGFGPRLDRPLPEVNDFHSGTDIAAACGAAVYAANAGIVTAAEPLGTYGNWILIDHGNGVATGYAHLAEGQTLVGVGETVIAGQVIASVGSTGSSTGCHLHFEVRADGAAIDARPFLVARGVQFDG